MKRILSIQYPSGGFGHFINIVISKFGTNFFASDQNTKFGVGGHSHSFQLALPKYFNIDNYDQAELDQKLASIPSHLHCTLLVDSGIDNDSQEYTKIIDSTRLRITYDDWSWPLLAKMFYTRCMAAVLGHTTSVSDFIKVDARWTSSESWAVREKYFLYLRDHHFRQSWREHASCEFNLAIDKILNYDLLLPELGKITPISDFKNFYNEWYDTNNQHFAFYHQARQIVQNIGQINQSLSDVVDVFTQACVYYYIWLQFRIEVPHNDYSNWFENTNQIVTMLQNQGYDIDTA